MWNYILAYSGTSGSLFKNKWIKTVVSKKTNSLFAWGWDRKIRPLGSPFVIKRQASWCQTAILGTDFSILASHLWYIHIVIIMNWSGVLYHAEWMRSWHRITQDAKRLGWSNGMTSSTRRDTVRQIKLLLFTFFLHYSYFINCFSLYSR